MLSTFIPILFLFCLGIILRRIGFLEKQHADLFLKLAVFVALPALIIPSFAALPLSLNLFILPIAAITIMLTLFCVTLIFLKAVKIEMSKETTGTFLIGTMIMNLSFVLAFFLATQPAENVAYFLLFNVGHDILLFTFVYYLACFHGVATFDGHYAIKKVLLLPPLWAMVVGLLLNITNTEISLFLQNTATMLGSILVPLVLLALGIHFTIKIKVPFLVFSGIIIRMGIGLILGLIFVHVFALEGMYRFVIVLCSFAPIGFNTLVFSSIEKLDTELAAQLVATSLFIGMLAYPLFFWVIG